jgi:hypothetical protein
MKFRKGDKVIIAEDSQYRDQGYRGDEKMLGIITSDVAPDCWMTVKWYYGGEVVDSNVYMEEDLILYDICFKNVLKYPEIINEDVVLIRKKSKRRKIQVLDF